MYVGANIGGSRPLRVSVNGTVGVVPYAGVLDVFHYNIGSQAESVFNLTALCGSSLDGGNVNTGGGDSSSGTSTAATVIMVLIFIGVACLLALWVTSRF